MLIFASLNQCICYETCLHDNKISPKTLVTNAFLTSGKWLYLSSRKSFHVMADRQLNTDDIELNNGNE